MFSWVLILLIILASIDTKSLGIFIQKRVGEFGKYFNIIKIKTIDEGSKKSSKFGNYLRETKFDELPQLYNILIGEMSFVGPRPDVPGYYDRLKGNNRKVLELKPGLTSEASLKYRHEEEVLKLQKNASKYNNEIIFPDKVKMNLEYYYNHTILMDIKIIIKTIFKI